MTIALQLVPAHELEAGLLEEATAFLDSQGSTHPFQYPGWAPLQDPRSRNYCAFVRDGQRIRLFARCATIRPLGKRFPWLEGLVIVRGPVCDDLELLRFSLTELVSRARQLGFAYIEISPDWVDSQAEKLAEVLVHEGWSRGEGSRASLRLDLQASADTIFEGLRKTTRYEVRRAERSGVQVAAATRESEFGGFFELHAEMARQKNFLADKPADMVGVLRRLLGEEKRGALLLASYQGTIRGGIVVVRAGKRCWYVWGATDKDATVNVGHILQWHGILWAKQNGCTEYDLGGYSEGATTGPALFKRGFSDKVVHFLDTRRYAVDPTRYQCCQLVWKARRRMAGLVS